jgi:hypothetical protein
MKTTKPFIKNRLRYDFYRSLICGCSSAANCAAARGETAGILEQSAK